jgi:LmbE family N-acetylglucosaminyl deacetylase
MKPTAAMRRVSRLAARRTQRVMGPWRTRANASWRSAVTAHGSQFVLADVTSLLVIAPHPDDETIGCAALMTRSRATGAAVTAVVVASGETSNRSAMLDPAQLAAIRREESRTACALLGVDDVRFLQLDEADLRRDTAPLSAALAEIIAREEPSHVVIPSAHEWHPEHRVVQRAASVALVDAGFRGLVREYPVWYWNDGPAPTAPYAAPWITAWHLLRWYIRRRVPHTWLVDVDEHVGLKRRAFAAYRTQTTSFTGEASWQPLPQGWLDKFATVEVFFDHTPPRQRRGATWSTAERTVRRTLR